MKTRFLAPLVAATAALLGGCLGNTGSSLPPPTNVTATAGDASVIFNWDTLGGAEYFLFYGFPTATPVTSASITPDSWPNLPLRGALTYVNPPAAACGFSYPYIVNGGPTLAGTVDARTGSAPGGAGSPAVWATARPAGDTWTEGPVIGGTSTAGLVRGAALAVAVSTPCAIAGTYIAVGAGGKAWWSSGPALTDANWNGADAAWSAATLPATQTTNLNAVAVYTSSYQGSSSGLSQLAVAVGDGGATITSPDGKTWTQGAGYSASASNLNAVANDGSTFIAVGDAGTIEYSTDGKTWTTVASGTSANLYTVGCFGFNGTTTCIAAGAGGTVLTSTTAGVSWTSQTLGTGTWRSVAYGNTDLNAGNGNVYSASAAPTYTYATNIDTLVLAGDSGAFAYYAYNTQDQMTGWALGAAPVGAGANLAGLGYTTRFLAVDANGNTYANYFHAKDSPPVAWTATTQSPGLGSASAPPVALITNSNNATNGTRYLLVRSDGSTSSSF